MRVRLLDGRMIEYAPTDTVCVTRDGARTWENIPASALRDYMRLDGTFGCMAPGVVAPVSVDGVFDESALTGSDGIAADPYAYGVCIAGWHIGHRAVYGPVVASAAADVLDEALYMYRGSGTEVTTVAVHVPDDGKGAPYAQLYEGYASSKLALPEFLQALLASPISQRRIAQEVFDAPQSVRMEVLQGICDSIGSVDPVSFGTSHRVRLHMPVDDATGLHNPGFVADVHRLALLCGYEAFPISATAHHDAVRGGRGWEDVCGVLDIRCAHARKMALFARPDIEELFAATADLPNEREAEPYAVGILRVDELG